MNALDSLLIANFFIDKMSPARYNTTCCVGAWCNGNTWVSKTFVVGSNPTAPAKQPVSQETGCFCIVASTA